MLKKMLFKQIGVKDNAHFAQKLELNVSNFIKSKQLIARQRLFIRLNDKAKGLTDAVFCSDGNNYPLFDLIQGSGKAAVNFEMVTKVIDKIKPLAAFAGVEVPDEKGLFEKLSAFKGFVIFIDDTQTLMIMHETTHERFLFRDTVKRLIDDSNL